MTLKDLSPLQNAAVNLMLNNDPAEWLAYQMTLEQDPLPETTGEAMELVKAKCRQAIEAATKKQAEKIQGLERLVAKSRLVRRKLRSEKCQLQLKNRRQAEEIERLKTVIDNQAEEKFRRKQAVEIERERLRNERLLFALAREQLREQIIREYEAEEGL